MSEQMKEGTGVPKPSNAPQHAARSSGMKRMTGLQYAGAGLAIVAVIVALILGIAQLNKDNDSSSTPAQTQTPTVAGNAPVDLSRIDLSKCPDGVKHYFANDVTDNSNSMGLPIQVPLNDDGAKQAADALWQTDLCDPSHLAQDMTAYNLLGTDLDFDSNAAQQLAVKYDSDQASWQDGYSAFAGHVTGFTLKDGGTATYMSVGQFKNPNGGLPTFTLWGQEQGLGPVLVIHTDKGDIQERLACHLQFEKETLRVPPTETTPPPPPPTCDNGCCTGGCVTTTPPPPPPPCNGCCDDTCVTTTTPPPPPPPCIPPPGNQVCMPPKNPTPNPSKPSGIVPLPLPPEDTFQPTHPTLTNQETTPIPVTAPPVHTTPRTSTPSVPTELPKKKNTTMPSDPGQAP